MPDDPYPCPLCGGPRPWEAWFSKDGKGCRHPEPRPKVHVPYFDRMPDPTAPAARQEDP